MLVRWLLLNPLFWLIFQNFDWFLDNIKYLPRHYQIKLKIHLYSNYKTNIYIFIFLLFSIKYTSNFNDNQMQFSCLLSKMINIKSLQSRETFVLTYSHNCHSCYYYSCCCMHNVICLHYKCILRGENVYINKKTFFLLRQM